MSLRSRRQFLEDSMLATAAALAASSASSVFAKDEKPGANPNDKLSVAVVGVKGRGTSHIDAYTKRKDVEITYVVDVDEVIGKKRVEEIEKKQGRAPRLVADMRQAFEDKSLDLVSIATPNHWHALAAIWAMQAGKDVYVEKPVSHNVSEGRRAVQVARKYNKICQTGTQSRSMQGMRDAIQYIHDGKIGEVKLARGLCYKRRGSIGPKGEYAVAPEINYDLWSGPAPLLPLTRKQLHYDWHWMWPYGNGDLGNQGIHQMDIARWGLKADQLSSSILSYGGRLGYEDAGDTPNTQVVVHDYGDKTLVFEVRGLKTEPYKGAGVGVIFEGSDGYVVMPSYESATAFDKKGEVVTTFKKGGDHFANFLDAVRSRKKEDLHADILEGHLSSALCHLGNISYLLGSPTSVADAKERVQTIKSNDASAETFERTTQHLKDNGVDLAQTQIRYGAHLKLDPKKETFIDNSAADAMLTRQYRAPFVVPTEDKV
jgi:predicted dehydrogenase